MGVCRFACIVVLFAALPASADNDRAAAREHYLKGTRAFDLGAYEEAIQEYGAAYRTFDDPALLYNLGQANRLAGHATEALRLYRVYLNKKPDAPNRVEVETKIAELQKLVEQQAKTTKSVRPDQVTPPPAAAPTESEPKPEARAAQQPTTPAAAEPVPTRVDLHAGRNKKIAAIAIGAVGVAALATGIAFGVLAKNAGDDLSRLDQQMGTFDASKQSEGQTDQIVEGVMLGVGGAALVTGVVLYVLGHREARAARSSTATVLPLLGPRQAGASLQVRF